MCLWRCRSEDKRRLADLKAEVIRLEFQVKHTKQQTEEIAKWSTEALQGLNKVKAQVSHPRLRLTRWHQVLGKGRVGLGNPG